MAKLLAVFRVRPAPKSAMYLLIFCFHFTTSGKLLPSQQLTTEAAVSHTCSWLQFLPCERQASLKVKTHGTLCRTHQQFAPTAPLTQASNSGQLTTPTVWWAGEVTSSIHVPDHRNLPQCVAIHGWGEVIWWLELIHLSQRQLEVIIPNYDGVCGPDADNWFSTCWLQVQTVCIIFTLQSPLWDFDQWQAQVRSQELRTHRNAKSRIVNYAEFLICAEFSHLLWHGTTSYIVLTATFHHSMGSCHSNHFLHCRGTMQVRARFVLCRDNDVIVTRMKEHLIPCGSVTYGGTTSWSHWEVLTYSTLKWHPLHAVLAVGWLCQFSSCWLGIRPHRICYKVLAKPSFTWAVGTWRVTRGFSHGISHQVVDRFHGRLCHLWTFRGQWPITTHLLLLLLLLLLMGITTLEHHWTFWVFLTFWDEETKVLSISQGQQRWPFA